jgi:hypothetical protein
MDHGSSKVITQALAKWNDGDDSALRSVLPLVYDELRNLARVYQPEMQKLPRGRSWSGNERLQDV